MPYLSPVFRLDICSALALSMGKYLLPTSLRSLSNLAMTLVASAGG